MLYTLKFPFLYKHLVPREKRLSECKVASEKRQHSNPDSQSRLELPVPLTTSQNVNLTAIIVLRIIILHLHQYHDRIYLPLADCSSSLSFSTSAFFLRKFPLARKAFFFAFFSCISFSERREIFFLNTKKTNNLDVFKINTFFKVFVNCKLLRERPNRIFFPLYHNYFKS